MKILVDPAILFWGAAAIVIFIGALALYHQWRLHVLKREVRAIADRLGVKSPLDI